jgi:hypothetical protein
MPLINRIRQNRVLTNLSVRYQPGTHVANSVAPRIPVAQEADIFYVYDFAAFEIPETLRAPRSRYNQIDWSVNTDTYFAIEYGLEQPIDDRERRNAVGVLDIERDSTFVLTSQLLNARERRVANIVKSTSTYPAGHSLTLTGAAQWTDPSSDPLGDVADGRVQIQKATGLLPNVMLLGWNVVEALLVHPDITPYGATAGGQSVMQLADLARIFRVDDVIAGSVLTNTANPGQATSLGDLWASDVVLFRRENQPALRTPSFMYQFVAADFRVFQYRNEEITSDIIRVNEIVAEKVVAPKLGYIIKAAAA